MHIGDAQLSLRVFWRVLEGGVKASKKAQSQEKHLQGGAILRIINGNKVQR
jgi:hypothetical protein